MIRTLVEEKGVWPNIQAQGSQAIHVAASYGQLDIVKYLVLECGMTSTSATARVDVNVAMPNGQTPLILALRRKQEAVALWLLREANANVLNEDEDGITTVC